MLLTGAAGFVGFHVANRLLDLGLAVTGVDNLNAYYPVKLKEERLKRLQARDGFDFHRIDIADHEAMKALPAASSADVVLHLAAQAGVRYSLENPFAYAQSNLIGHLSILELVRHAPQKPLLVYASSSSVYGANTKAPFSEEDRVDDPVSLYAATKRSGELMSEAYSRLYGMEQVGLRFFTVYGPWGRPDMAYWSFTQNILEGKPIRVFNNGDLQRDFTWIDDIVDGRRVGGYQGSRRARRPGLTASTTSATTGRKSCCASSRSWSRRRGRRPRRSSSRCSRAMCVRPTPMSTRSRATTALRRRRRWSRAFRALWNGFAAIAGSSRQRLAKPSVQKPKEAFSQVGLREASIRTPSTSTLVPPARATLWASSL